MRSTAQKTAADAECVWVGVVIVVIWVRMSSPQVGICKRATSVDINVEINGRCAILSSFSFPNDDGFLRFAVSVVASRRTIAVDPINLSDIYIRVFLTLHLAPALDRTPPQRQLLLP